MLRFGEAEGDQNGFLFYHVSMSVALPIEGVRVHHHVLVKSAFLHLDVKSAVDAESFMSREGPTAAKG